MFSDGAGGGGDVEDLATHDDHRHRPRRNTNTEQAFDRLDALMSRQHPNAKIPQPIPIGPPTTDDLLAMWDEMAGLWMPRGVR
jgi:hypothetical protein